MVLNCLYSFLGDIIFLFKSLACFCACVYAYMAGVNIWCSLHVFQLYGLVYFFSRTVRNIYVLRKLFLCQPYSLQIFIPSFITQFVFWLGLFNCAAIPFREEFIDPAVAGSAVIWQSLQLIDCLSSIRFALYQTSPSPTAISTHGFRLRYKRPSPHGVSWGCQWLCHTV